MARSLTERVEELEIEVRSLKAQIDFMADEYDGFKELCLTIFKDLNYEIKCEDNNKLDS